MEHNKEIISMWVYLKILNENGTYSPTCLHYSDKDHFESNYRSLNRQMSINKITQCRNDFSNMSYEDILKLPTKEEFIQNLSSLRNFSE